MMYAIERSTTAAKIHGQTSDQSRSAESVCQTPITAMNPAMNPAAVMGYRKSFRAVVVMDPLKRPLDTWAVGLHRRSNFMQAGHHIPGTDGFEDGNWDPNPSP